MTRHPNEEGNLPDIQRKQKRKFFKNWITGGDTFFIGLDEDFPQAKKRLRSIYVEDNTLKFNYTKSAVAGDIEIESVEINIPECTYVRSQSGYEDRVLSIHYDGKLYALFRQKTVKVFF